MTEPDLFTEPLTAKNCANCAYLCESLGKRGSYYCDLSKKDTAPSAKGCTMHYEVRA